jgi:septum formation protein
MRQAGLEFEVVVGRCAEPMIPNNGRITAAVWAETLAYLKARSVAEDYHDAVVIGADTVVAHDEHIIGKPTDENDARRILSSLFAGRNEVITGLAVLRQAAGRQVVTHDKTILMMRPMEQNEIERYIRSGAWRDKAGAYALQEGGDRFVQSMEGSESNVVGLPMEKLLVILKQFE